MCCGYSMGFCGLRCDGTASGYYETVVVKQHAACKLFVPRYTSEMEELIRREEEGEDAEAR